MPCVSVPLLVPLTVIFPPSVEMASLIWTLPAPLLSREALVWERSQISAFGWESLNWIKPITLKYKNYQFVHQGYKPSSSSKAKWQGNSKINSHCQKSACRMAALNCCSVQNNRFWALKYVLKIKSDRIPVKIHFYSLGCDRYFGHFGHWRGNRYTTLVFALKII